MRLLATLALATLLAACSKDPCQELGERICSCSGIGTDACKTQVEDGLKQHGMDEATCDKYLASCNEPDGVAFCEWLLTEAGKTNCGITAPP